MLGGKKKDEPVYLVVWWDDDLSDQDPGELRHEVIAHDSELMHKFVNERRDEIGGIDQVTRVAVFEVKDPKALAGNLEIVFREGDTQ